MAQPKKVSGIDISEDMAFQEREWKVQRVAWVVIAVLLLAALLGFLGRGPFSRADAGEQNGPLFVEYERLERYEAPTEMDITVGPNTAQGEELRLTLNNDFLDRIAISSIEPEPDAAEAAGDRTVYVFRVAEPGQASRITFAYEFNTPGSAPVELGIENGTTLTFSQFIFP